MPVKPNIGSLSNEFGKSAEGLKSILLVGAVINADNTLSDADRGQLWFALKKLAELQIPVAKNCVVELVNLELKEDFLKGTYPAEAIVVCNVPDIASRPDRSPHYSETGIWPASAKRSGAQFVITFGDRQEVTGNHFAQGGEFKCIATGAEIGGYQVMRAVGPAPAP